MQAKLVFSASPAVLFPTDESSATAFCRHFCYPVHIQLYARARSLNCQEYAMGRAGWFNIKFGRYMVNFQEERMI
jgi:hypothetical protein